MATESTNKTILSVVATTSSKIKDLSIKDGQLVFCHDSRKIALDFNGRRIFYNQITELESEVERQSLLAPITGQYYFVIKTAVLWTYNSGWIQLTTPPQDIVFIGVEFPELGQEKTLYVNKTEKYISVWDDATQKYITVAEANDEATNEDILTMFNKTDS